MNPKIKEIVATLREYAPDKDGTQRYILIPAAGRGAIAEYPVTVRSHRTDIMREAADIIEQLHQELIDERYRHDRYADFCVAQGEELSKLKAQQRWIPVTERLPEESCAAWAFDRDSRGESSMHLAFFVEKAGWMPPITSEKDAYWQHILEPEPPKED